MTNMGLGLNKYIEHQEDILFFIIIIEFVIILILFLSLFYRRRYDEDDKKENISDISKKNNQDNESYWENLYYKLQNNYYNLEKDFNNLKYGNGRKISNSRSNHLEEKANGLSPKETEFTNRYSDYTKEEIRKGIYLKEIKNEDGTIKSEIEFDDTNDGITPIPTHLKYEYLEAANGGQFRKLLSSDEKCFFRTWEENGIRKFEFHGNVDKALANINAIFDDVCDIEGKQNGSTQIINVEPGILNNQLKVEKRAKIKLA